MKQYEEDFKRALEGLNDAQKKAVKAIDGPVMVIAGPGTGKTQILTFRIANILNTHNEPESILALTYTTAGVISMRERLVNLIGDSGYRVNIFTFHAFCEHLIKEFPFYFSALQGARVVTDLERVEIIESIIQKNKFKELVSFHDEFSFLKKIVNAILAIKKEGLSPDEFLAKLPLWKKDMLASDDMYYKRATGEYKKGDLKPTEVEKVNKKVARAEELGNIFIKYQEEIKKRGLYDFSDMILYVRAELEKNPDFKADVSEKYQYILVDEHQDTNEGQNAIIESLSDAPHLEGKPNVFTVGDEKQSIYKFQGATKETFSRFVSLYQDIVSITLADNYRSTQNILDGAHSLMRVSVEHAESIRLLSHSDEKNEKIEVREFSNFKFELLSLAEEIKNKISEGVAPSEIAVLYRANKNVADIKPIFDFMHIPYTILSQDNILEDAHIKNLIFLLKVISNPNDDVSLGKVLFARFLKLDAYDIVKILEKYRSLRKAEKKHVFAIINDKKMLKDMEVRTPEQFSRFAEIIKELKTESENNNFPDFFKIFLEKTGYLSFMLEGDDSRLQLTKVNKLFNEIKKQDQTKKDYTLSDFVYFIDSFVKYKLDIKSTDPEIIEGVSLMTAHGSKGREFSYVYIINATRKAWEARRGGTNNITLPIYQYDGDLEDERRLFYVAMTRAKAGLTISFAHIDDDGREHEESQFVGEIDTEFTILKNMHDFEKNHESDLSKFLNASRSKSSLFEPEYLRQLFFKRGLNVSALNNYLSCPIKFLYRNLIQLPDVSSSAQRYGNIIDIALNNFFKKSKQEEKILSKEVFMAEFEKSLSDYNVSEKEEEKFHERGEQAMSEYYDAYAKSWTAKVDAQKFTERDFKLSNGDNLRLSGTVDKIEYLDDLFSPHIHVVDHKTGRAYSEKTKEEKENYERQLVFYKLLLENPGKEDFIVRNSTLDFIEKNKKGVFEQHDMEATKEDLDKLCAEIDNCADEVLSMKFLTMGCNKKDCEWCSLFKA